MLLCCYVQTLVNDIMLLCCYVQTLVYDIMLLCCYVQTLVYDIMLLCFRKEHIKTMSNRILFMREQLHQKLKAIGCPGNWDHIVLQKGMFSYTGLNG